MEIFLIELGILIDLSAVRLNTDVSKDNWYQQLPAITSNYQQLPAITSKQHHYTLYM